MSGVFVYWGSSMFALNKDYPTEIGKIHVWPDGKPVGGHCRRRHKKPKNGAWYVFERYEDAREAIRSDGRRLEIEHCSYCDPVGVVGRGS